MRVLLAFILVISACGDKPSNREQTIVDSTTSGDRDTIHTATIDSVTSSLNPDSIIGISRKMGAFDVAANDYPSMQTWQLAKTSAESLGTGWRLPTLAELQLIYENKVSVGGFESDVYWTSEESSELNARTVNFSTGKKGNFSKIYSARIRAVRTN